MRLQCDDIYKDCLLSPVELVLQQKERGPCAASHSFCALFYLPVEQA